MTSTELAPLLLVPPLACVALEITRPLVYLRRGEMRGAKGRPLLPRPHWVFTLAYWLASSCLFVVLAVGLFVPTFGALLALTLSALYNLLAYHNGAELDGSWSSLRVRTLGWPRPRYRLLYELPTPSATDDPELTSTWRQTVARYEPRRLFALAPATTTIAAPTNIYYGNAGWWWAAYSAPEWMALRAGLTSSLPFAIPLVREAVLLSGCVIVPWDSRHVKNVYVDLSNSMVYGGGCAAESPHFVAVAQAGRNIAVGVPLQHYNPRQWEDLHAPLVQCKWQ